jgi:WD40 repeat protein
MEDENSKLKKDESSYHLSEDDALEDEGELGDGSDSKLLAGDKMISINLLDYKKLSKIKKDFKLKEEGLLKDQFINIMLHHLPEIKDKVSLVNSLNELFAEIDVNDDKHLEWDEFSDYIIEMGLVRKEQGFVDVIKNYKQSEWRDTIKHDNDIEYIDYFPVIKQLIVLERDSKKFKVYNMKNGKFDREVKGHTGAVISAYYIQEKKLVATSSNDLSIILWDDITYTITSKINSPIIPIVLTFHNDTLYAGGPEGMIYYWNMVDLEPKKLELDPQPKIKDYSRKSKSVKAQINTSKNSSPENKQSKSKYSKLKEPDRKNKAVSAMLPIPELNILVTSDLVGQILLWNIPSHTLNRKMLTLEKGIYSLDWSAKAGFLFSAGLERAAYVWNPYVNKYIYKLSGHIHSLVGVKCVPESYQLVTADISGMFKIWDIRTFTCIQSFNAPVAELNSFTVTYPEKKIIAGAKRLYQYTYEEPKDQNKVDEGLPLMCLYNFLYNTFITAHPSCIKIWNCSTGKLVRVFRNLTPDDITTIQLDNKRRKLFLGDSKGRVLTFKVKNGTKIKKFKKHAGEVTCLLFWSELRYLISASWDRKVKVHDDSRGGDKGTIRFDQIKHNDIVNAIDLKEKGKYLASCSDDCTVLITNLRTLRQEVDLIGHEGELKALKFLNPHHCLVVTDLLGYFYFWAVAPSNLKNTIILKIPNQIAKDTGGFDNCPVRALDWDQETSTLYAGDDLGNIRSWDASILLSKLQRSGNKKDEFSNEEILSEVLVTVLNLYGENVSKKIEPGDLKIRHEWKAHEEGIIHINLLEDLKILVTCSFDYRVHVWDVTGVKLGTLIVGGDPDWRVKIDVLPRFESARKEAIELLDLSQEKTYEQIIMELSTIEKPNSDSDESEEEVDKTKSIFAKLDMSFPTKEKPVTNSNTLNKKSLNTSKIQSSPARSIQPKRTLSNSGRRILNKN